MTFASLIALAVNHHLKATQKLLTANELGTTKLGEIEGVLTVVIATAFTIEGITFVALFPGLYKVNHGNVRHTLWESLFFAVMAYNNAGFTPDGAGLHVNNWAVGLPILVSAFCGTLGFPVLLNLMRSWRNHRPPKRWSLHTKLTLTTTFCIVLASFTGSSSWNGTTNCCSPPKAWNRGCGMRWWQPSCPQLRLRPVMDAGRERRDEGVPVHRHVHRRRQHFDRRRHPRHHIRRDSVDLPRRVHPDAMTSTHSIVASIRKPS